MKEEISKITAGLRRDALSKRMCRNKDIWQKRWEKKNAALFKYEQLIRAKYENRSLLIKIGDTNDLPISYAAVAAKTQQRQPDTQQNRTEGPQNT